MNAQRCVIGSFKAGTEGADRKKLDNSIISFLCGHEAKVALIEHARGLDVSNVEHQAI